MGMEDILGAIGGDADSAILEADNSAAMLPSLHARTDVAWATR
jgi:hypothetical protein